MQTNWNPFDPTGAFTAHLQQNWVNQPPDFAEDIEDTGYRDDRQRGRGSGGHRYYGPTRHPYGIRPGVVEEGRRRVGRQLSRLVLRRQDREARSYYGGVYIRERARAGVPVWGPNAMQGPLLRGGTFVRYFGPLTRQGHYYSSQ